MIRQLWRNLPLEFVVLLYLVSYLPNVIVTKLVTSLPHAGLGRPLTGLETLPASLIVNLVLTYAFIWLSGWHRDAHAVAVSADGRHSRLPQCLQLPGDLPAIEWPERLNWCAESRIRTFHCRAGEPAVRHR